MENSPIVVGLDIGTTKICTIVGRKNEHGKIDILGYGKAESLGVSRGVVTNIGLTIDSIRKSLQEASARHRRTAYQEPAASRHGDPSFR
jgi:cell division protein FtsA